MAFFDQNFLCVFYLPGVIADKILFVKNIGLLYFLQRVSKLLRLFQE